MNAEQIRELKDRSSSTQRIVKREPLEVCLNSKLKMLHTDIIF